MSGMIVTIVTNYEYAVGLTYSCPDLGLSGYAVLQDLLDDLDERLISR
jgi:hypothetical protein